MTPQVEDRIIQFVWKGVVPFGIPVATFMGLGLFLRHGAISSGDIVLLLAFAFIGGLTFAALTEKKNTE